MTSDLTLARAQESFKRLMNTYDPLTYFQLKPIDAAKVSEISEATALSPVSPEDRVNFHIGNPVQDQSLQSLYLRLVLALKTANEHLSIGHLTGVAEELDIREKERWKLRCIADMIMAAGPYSPRGGYLKSKPNNVVQRFNEWLTRGQAESLLYDLGEKSGRREIVLSSGGVYETLRILLHSISEYLIHLPANIFLFAIDIPEHLKRFRSLRYETLSVNETAMVKQLKEYFTGAKQPSFLILGSKIKEDTRRYLRNLSLDAPLFFVEVNDAPNHLSLAREAKMMDRVLRIITPAIFSPALKEYSLLFVAGNSEFIKAFETVHFQLKGTPSSTEITLLPYLLNYLPQNPKDHSNGVVVEADYEGHTKQLVGFAPWAEHLRSVEQRVTEYSERQTSRISAILTNLNGTIATHSSRIDSLIKNKLYDHFFDRDALALLDELIENIGTKDWTNILSTAYLSAFLNHHPEYDARYCTVVSGSARTALSLLGFHCGIREAIIPDLSWTYEHCFPQVSAVSLTDDFQIDVEAIQNAVREKINGNPNWKTIGAVVLNNPHNATGHLFDVESIRELIRWLLQQKVIVIDDLSYQNVEPKDNIREIPTLRQLTNDLVGKGYLTDEESNYLITIHSMSKTDSYAGARLSVMEIRHAELCSRFNQVNSVVTPNVGAIFLAYLFYRNKVEDVKAYYRLRNRILQERSQALVDAVENLPSERNRYHITIRPPVGSMYPQLTIEKLPSGLSLDWLSSELARQGIGLIPLSIFARTESGFEAGRKTFRLTLGGTDSSEILLKKTRRVLIDLNRIIADDSSHYHKKECALKHVHIRKYTKLIDKTTAWEHAERQIQQNIEAILNKRLHQFNGALDGAMHRHRFCSDFLSYKLSRFRQRFHDRQNIANEYLNFFRAGNEKKLIAILEREFYKDDLVRRKELFKQRIFDRTVHPTQMYSLKSELLFEQLIDNMLRNKDSDRSLLRRIQRELVNEYLGTNVAIVSGDEPQEVILDLNSMLDAENFMAIHSDHEQETFLSFWGDWDGTNRPSGQGHSLVAFVLIENIVRQVSIIQSIVRAESRVKVDPKLLREIELLPRNNDRFSQLLHKITYLTHQLERRYRGTLPFNLQPKRLRRLGMKLHLARDPAERLLQHNDRLERKMLELREKRRTTLEYYFSLNKRIRKTLRELIPCIAANSSNTDLLLNASLFRDLMRRFVVTPRINQNLITAHDQFAIDTTVHNLHEINAISGAYGNPGMVLALQVSMTTKAEAIISLDRKLRSKREAILRDTETNHLPNIWIVPLFEDIDSIRGLRTHLDLIWDYAIQSRRLHQDAAERFTEIITEVFIAGSDISQQVGQPTGMNLYLEAKHELMSWLASRNLIGTVRMKMGSGEPMQRQGGYYSHVAGKPLFNGSPRVSTYLRESTKKSTEYATTPLLGIFSRGDFRTFQSNVSEALRFLPTEERAQFYYHVRESQRFFERELIRAGEPLSETRLQFTSRGFQELERLTVGRRDNLYNEFLEIHRENFRQILYGREEDVVGIHAISYFIGRTTPPLRDRPTARPGKGTGEKAGQQILERIAGTIPFSKYGSLLRAIAHNQSQTVVLGINQLTTGLFRSLDSFSKRECIDSDPLIIISERILPHLPVYEILSTLRMYHDVQLTYLNKMEKAFPAGNSALIALREDIDSMHLYVPLFQKELLRRHGVGVREFFRENTFIPDLLPAIRPDVAVLLQENLFNTDIEFLVANIHGSVDVSWRTEVERLLAIPEEIRRWRRHIWELLEEPVFQRVASFVEIAHALHSLSTMTNKTEYYVRPARLKTSPHISQLPLDDSMQQFLSAALEYLSTISQEMVEIPIGVIRALKEIEKIIKIEEQALSKKQQNLLRFYLLQIARIAGENG